jgi:hypothetical protein
VSIISKKGSEKVAKYGNETKKQVKKEIDKYKKGKWKSRKQAIAVGLSEAREKGYKVPAKKS